MHPLLCWTAGGDNTVSWFPDTWNEKRILKTISAGSINFPDRKTEKVIRVRAKVSTHFFFILSQLTSQRLLIANTVNGT
jgi:hypothetical protein